MNMHQFALLCSLMCFFSVRIGIAMPPPPPPPPGGASAAPKTVPTPPASEKEPEKDKETSDDRASSEQVEESDVHDPEQEVDEPTEEEVDKPTEEAQESTSDSAPVDAPSDVPVDNAPPVQSSSSPSPSSSIASVKPLFANMKGKELFAHSEEDERKARETIQRIESVKSKQLREVYLPLDKELDAFYEKVGMARGSAKSNLAQIRETLWKDLESGQADARDDLQENMNDRTAKMDALQEAFAMLIEREGAVVKLMHELSTTVGDAFDQATQMYTRRLELQGVANEQAAQQLYEKISNVDDDLVSIEEGLSADGGLVARLTKAVTDARAQVAVVQGELDGLSALKIDVAAKAADLGSQESKQAAGGEGDLKEAAPEEADKQEPEKALVRMTKGTTLEDSARRTDELLTRTWGMLEPVRTGICVVFGWVRDLCGAIGRGLFGTRSAPKVTPGEESANDEISWGELTGQFVGKVSASMQRGVKKIVAWWNGVKSVGKKKKKTAPVEDTAALTEGGEVVVGGPPVVATESEELLDTNDSALMTEGGEVVVGGASIPADTQTQVDEIKANAAVQVAQVQAEVAADMAVSEEDTAQAMALIAETNAVVEKTGDFK